jgi:hypothetical protein
MVTGLSAAGELSAAFDFELVHPAAKRLAAVRTAIEALMRADFIVTPCSWIPRHGPVPGCC